MPSAYISGMGKVNVAPADYYKGGGGGITPGAAIITSSIVSAIGDIAVGFMNAGAATKASKYRTQSMRMTADFNSEMADIQSRMTMNAAKYEIKQIRRRSDMLYSKQRSQYTKAGVTLEGSPAEIMMKSLQEGEQDALITGINAEYEAWGIKARTDTANIALRIGDSSATGAYARAASGAGKTILDLGTKYLMYEGMNKIK